MAKKQGQARKILDRLAKMREDEIEAVSQEYGLSVKAIKRYREADDERTRQEAIIELAREALPRLRETVLALQKT